MTNITLSVPNDVHAKMRSHPEIRWSEIARQAIMQKLQEMEGKPHVIVARGWRPPYRGMTGKLREAHIPGPPKELMDRLEKKYREVA